MTRPTANYAELASLYDVFVDWPGRLSREMPGLTARLSAANAKRVLDVGCGTGRHVQALIESGYEAHGCDADDDMLSRARTFVDPARLHRWRLGDPPPRSLSDVAPFDAITCLGNVWPHVVGDEDVRSAIGAMHDLLRPGGAAVVGLKAAAVQREQKRAYLPLLKRRHDDDALYFVRFLDFDVTDPAGVDICRMHMCVLRGESMHDASVALHEVRTMRVWAPTLLHEAFAAGGFDQVHVSASLADPHVEPTDENVFVHAIRR